MALHKVRSTLHLVDRSPSAGSREAASGASWAPNTDVYQTDHGLVVKVELAGMKRQDLELTMEGNRLRIRGNRADGCRAPNCKFIIMEINYGAFETMIELPPGYNYGQAVASYQNGFLRVDIPAVKQNAAKSQKIPVSIQKA